MKSLKIVLGSLLLTVGIITLSSFVSAKFDKHAFAIDTCYYFGLQSQVLNKEAVTNQTYTGNLTQGQVEDEDNWGGSPSNPPSGAICNGLPNLCAVCFDSAIYTKAQAIARVWAYYAANGNTLPNGGDISVATDNSIRVYLQTSTANH